LNKLGLPPRQGLLKEKDVAGFDAPFFQLSHKQAQAMDPAIRILLHVSYEALMDAQIDIRSLRGSKTGVYVGHCFSDSLG
jgi:fatty acid synthase